MIDGPGGATNKDNVVDGRLVGIGIPHCLLWSEQSFSNVACLVSVALVSPTFVAAIIPAGDQGVVEGGLAVADVRDDGHVPDVLLLVHAFPHLVCLYDQGYSQ